MRASSVLLPLSGGSIERVNERWRKFARTAGATAVLAKPADLSIDVTGREPVDLVAAFEIVEQVDRLLMEWRGVIIDALKMGAVNPRKFFHDHHGARERFLTLTRSAAHVYKAFSQSAIERHAFERALDTDFAEFGELLVCAIEVLEYTARAGGGRG